MSPSSEKERMEMSQVPYASAVGSLMSAMICTRPNIAHAMGVVSRYMAEPGRGHWEAVKMILRYIKGTLDVALCFRDSDLIVKGYVDSDYAVVAMSTTEVEYVAASQASKETVWLKMLLEELGHEQEKITLFCDNQSALYLARNPAFHSKTKHIRIVIVAMAAKFEIEKFNGNNFSLWKLKMKAILRKDKCLAAIGERPAEVTDDSKWDEMDGNAIANLANPSVLEKKIGENREERQTSFKDGGNLAVYEKEVNGNLAPVGSQICKSEIGNMRLLEGRKTMQMSGWDLCYKLQCSGTKEILELEVSSVEVHDVWFVLFRTAEDRSASHSPSHKVAVTWHQKLGHVSTWNEDFCGEEAMSLGCSKAPVLSLGEAKYFVSFTDDYSKRCWVYSIKKKSDVFEVFKVYKARVELDSGTKIKCLRTDNGGEYTGDEFDLFCKQEGIKRQFTLHNSSTEWSGRAADLNLLERA
ncbi:retrovirus-related pol polyprotein from transposon TNT 1-94 [Tanacetum coccineum]